MAELMKLPRNETGIGVAVALLKQRFGDRLDTGEAIREQHGHTVTWIETQPPDAVVFVESAEEVSKRVNQKSI